MDLKAAVAAVIAGLTTTAANGVPRGATTVAQVDRPAIAVDGPAAVADLVAAGPAAAAGLVVAAVAVPAAVTAGEDPLVVAGGQVRTADRFN